MDDFNENILKMIRETFRKVAEKFGYDVDMEWAIKDNILYWLQVRPVTGIVNKNECDRFSKEVFKLSGDWFLMDQCDKPFVPLFYLLFTYSG
ncbi:hypothetical protein BBF96_13805 [Anoxybacter fermentans]|uniref:Uncharacterized protein n=1 Tax=Anoxybacter fermentans TaxID=1323375 RepID=A0A3Q9HS21_9FIRM|nr:PEP/pyruvate-binding domain-containing protein [Anoxybacter fermentans]AZR74368.1 hypothetical protein BBF96_13805 [Anoxybacter fermentans]